jgi:hypothetical protein
MCYIIIMLLNLPFDLQRHDTIYHGRTLAPLPDRHIQNTHSKVHVASRLTYRPKFIETTTVLYLSIPEMSTHKIGYLPKLNGKYFMHSRNV